MPYVLIKISVLLPFYAILICQKCYLGNRLHELFVKL